MRRRLHTALVYFGFLEDRDAAAEPPRTFRERFVGSFVFAGCLLAVLSAIQGDLATALVLAACVLVLVAIGAMRRRRDRS